MTRCLVLEVQFAEAELAGAQLATSVATFHFAMRGSRPSSRAKIRLHLQRGDQPMCAMQSWGSLKDHQRIHNAQLRELLGLGESASKVEA